MTTRFGLGIERAPDILVTRDLRFPPASGYTDGGHAEGPQLPPRLGTPSDAAYVRLQFPPWVVKLPSSADFNVQNYALTLAAGAGSVIAGPSFRLPAGQLGYLQSSGLYLLTPTAATSVTMQIRINQGPIPGFDQLQNAPGIANFSIFPLNDDMEVKLPPGALVDFLITNNNGGGPWTVGGFLSGWYHPESAEQRAWGEGR